MSIEADLKTFLAADGTIAGLVSTRIFGVGYRPQGGTVPSVVYSRESTEWITFADIGQSGYIGADFQIDAWADNYDDAHTLREAIISRLQNYQGAMGSTAVDRAFINAGPIDVYEDSVEQYRSSVGVTIWYNS